MNLKTCKQCGQCKPLSDFYSTGTTPFARCKRCCIENAKAKYRANPGPTKAASRARYLADPERAKAESRARLLADPRVRMASAARKRDRMRGLPSDIEAKQIHIPAVCPVLGIPMEPNASRACPGSPSIDHFDAARGAVAGNWRVISYRANALKGDHTAESLTAFIDRVEHPERHPGQRKTKLQGGTALEDYRKVLGYLRNP